MNKLIHGTSDGGNMQKDKQQIGFWLHVLVETPACAMFCLYPSRQLKVYTPHAHAVIRQYALLLFTSVLIALKFAQRPPDELSGYVAASLSLYHIGPCLRALNEVVERHSSRNQKQERTSLLHLAEPTLYAIFHALTGVVLGSTFWWAEKS